MLVDLVEHHDAEDLMMPIDDHYYYFFHYYYYMQKIVIKVDSSLIFVDLQRSMNDLHSGFSLVLDSVWNEVVYWTVGKMRNIVWWSNWKKSLPGDTLLLLFGGIFIDLKCDFFLLLIGRRRWKIDSQFINCTICWLCRHRSIVDSRWNLWYGSFDITRNWSWWIGRFRIWRTVVIEISMWTITSTLRNRRSWVWSTS